MSNRVPGYISNQRDEIALVPPTAAAEQDETAARSGQGRGAIDLSVVIPIYNEEETLPELHRRLTTVLSSLPIRWEIILVNDGSRDGSLHLLRDFAEADRQIRYVDLSRNFGHQAALYAGLSRSSGRAVILMDGDLQDPPEVIPDLLERWKAGHQVVFAVRRKRKEGLAKRLAYAVYYKVLRSVAYVPIPVDSGDFSLMDRRVVDIILRLPERNKFLRGLRAWSGFNQTAFEYERDARYAGETKYTLVKLMRLALDGLLAYSFIPLRMAYLAGMVVSLASFTLAGIYIVQRLMGDTQIPQGFTTLAVLVLFLGGVQLLCLGILGEYLGRIYEEVKGRPEYLEREAVNFDA
jgi:polyisoprenyl-phosphate glycosyltransferase